MRSLSTFLALSGLAAVILVSAVLLPGCAGTSGRLAGEDGVSAQQQFDRLKALEGSWVGTASPAADAPPRVSYRATAGGSAVVETIFEGSPHEMKTVYHLDGADLVLTHYCVLGNQPHMRALPTTDEGTITFECTKVFNGSQDRLHMHKGVLVFVDGDHLRAEWSSLNEGVLSEPVVLELTRAD